MGKRERKGEEKEKEKRRENEKKKRRNRKRRKEREGGKRKTFIRPFFLEIRKNRETKRERKKR